jgi:hypothetical protein
MRQQKKEQLNQYCKAGRETDAYTQFNLCNLWSKLKNEHKRHKKFEERIE